MSAVDDVVTVEETGGALPPLKWDQGLFEQVELTVEKFRVFYQLQSNPGFFSFSLCGVKKILINPPKSFHDWKIKFFYIREEVIPIAMKFRDSAPIQKEDIKIPRGAAWYEKLLALPNEVFGEQVLVAAGMSDKWPHGSPNVPVLLLEDEGSTLIIAPCVNAEVVIYHRAFPAYVGVMNMRPLRDGEEYWFEQIWANFMYARVEMFAAPLVVTEGVHIPSCRPCRAITPAEKVVYLSSEESVV
ncbi:hypothetical protein Hanom_Chr12g01138921 [Helianthus anomalus]